MADRIKSVWHVNIKSNESKLSSEIRSEIVALDNVNDTIVVSKVWYVGDDNSFTITVIKDDYVSDADDDDDDDDDDNGVILGEFDMIGDPYIPMTSYSAHGIWLTSNKTLVYISINNDDNDDDDDDDDDDVVVVVQLPPPPSSYGEILTLSSTASVDSTPLLIVGFSDLFVVLNPESSRQSVDWVTIGVIPIQIEPKRGTLPLFLQINTTTTTTTTTMKERRRRRRRRSEYTVSINSGDEVVKDDDVDDGDNDPLNELWMAFTTSTNQVYGLLFDSSIVMN